VDIAVVEQDIAAVANIAVEVDIAVEVGIAVVEQDTAAAAGADIALEWDIVVADLDIVVGWVNIAVAVDIGEEQQLESVMLGCNYCHN